MRTLALTFVFLPLATAAAQTADVPERAFGVSAPDGVLRGVGPDYSARFLPEAVEFVPALGPRTGAVQSLRFTLRAVRRGATLVWSGAGSDVAPRAEGSAVVYERSSQLRERYDVRVDGIEQSFVFGERPPGHGDLVVEGELGGTLPFEGAANDGSLQFLAAGSGVSFGAVTGVAADGARVAGATWCDGRTVRLSLPAAFVDAAAYPLVLDPLLGTAFTVADHPSAPDRRPAAAFDVSSGRYYVVWEVDLGGGDGEIRGQIVAASGALVGAPVVLGTSERELGPVVANVNASNRFLVVWRHFVPSVSFPPSPASSQILCRAVDAATGALSPAVALEEGSPSLNWSKFAIGGDSRPFQLLATRDRALLVYQRSAFSLLGTYNFLQGLTVRVPAAGDPVLLDSATLEAYMTAGATPPFLYLEQPSLTSHAGSTGTWGLAYLRGDAPGGPSSVVLRRIDSTLAVCGTEVVVAPPTTGVMLLTPTVATRDGNEFVVAWEDSAGNAIGARRVVWSGTCAGGGWTLDPIATPVVSSTAVHTPDVDCAGDRYVLAWQQTSVSLQPPRILVKTLDPATCLPCSGTYAADSSSGISFASLPCVVTRWSGGDTSDEAMVVWTDGSIRARRLEATGSGAVAALGGGCGAGGTPGHQGQSVLGDPTFALTLGAPTAPALAAIVGLSNVSLPCGPCVLVPNTDIVMAGPGPHPIPIPCDTTWLGVQFWAQWLLFAPGGCAILPDFALSDAQRFTIGD
ncbi:MAG: hypothetical protein JNL08_16455 [Planctomycetes bacterium]|nr:hypothetical protein [Planctomycetota bacterium]